MNVTRYLLLFVILVLGFLGIRRFDTMANDGRGTTMPSDDVGPSHLPQINFYGRVVDERGAPVPDAEVAVMIATADPAATHGARVAKTKWLALKSDSNGEFSVRNERGLHIWISKVDKPGFDWVFDWAEKPIFDLKRDLVGNQFYVFDSGIGPVYESDPSRPAVFPLIRAGSDKMNKPSRGGSDRFDDGRVRINDPMDPLVPSAGPKAPTTAIERSKRLRELLVPSPTTRPE
ncbi:MAG TPA: carboxypeptidase-like regulatory domain-containing protein [Tepidisphaeraceae bacterium]|jgi:hypothetical protein|nr:carboxypeptidase-like regulatory domain-containing protein [Tepidisphaeraceae bacterium]